MKKGIALLLSIVMVCSLAAGCGSGSGETKAPESKAPSATTAETKAAPETSADAKETQPEAANPVELNVVTTYAGNDTNAPNFTEAVKAWEEATGNTVVDGSQTSNEAFKAQVANDFQTGSEPDVLFYFTGADANSFIDGGKVMSLDEIRAEYPDYGANMDDAKIPSATNGKKYVLPVNGIWESMFVNTRVLEEAGVEVPGADYTWDQFLADCEKIKAAGKTPIAVALGEVPHYWFEFTIYNYNGLNNHLTLPATADDEIGQNWVKGIEDIKALYEAGYMPANTNSATDAETLELFYQDEAAFLIDGNWRIGGIIQSCQSDPDDISTLDTEELEKFAVTYVPAKENRKATDLIGGCTAGYYITKKAWDDPEKRAAAINFVEYMTNDDIVMKFSGVGSHALKNAPDIDLSQFNSLEVKAINMVKGATGFVGAVQDSISTPCRVPLFDGMPKLVTGDADITGAVQECIDLMAEEAAGGGETAAE